MDIPAIIVSWYKNVILAGDIMFVNKIPFLMTVSRYIKFGTAVMIKNKSNKTVLAQIKAIQKVYMCRGFVITTLLMDGEFESRMRADLADLRITLTLSLMLSMCQILSDIFAQLKNERDVFTTCYLARRCHIGW